MKKNKIVYICILFAFLLLCIYQTRNQWSSLFHNSSLLKDSLQDRSVKILCGDYLGSGVIYQVTDEEVIILSVSHVLMFDVKAEVIFKDLSYTIGSIEIISSQSDLGYVRISMENLSAEQQEFLHSLTIKESDEVVFSKGDNVTLVASEQSPGGTILQGTILNEDMFVSEVNERVIITDIIVNTGMSGAGLYNEDGVLIGILIAGNNENSLFVPLIQDVGL